MKYLPHVLITAGLAILIFALIKIWQAGDDLDEYSPFPPGLDMDRLKMDADALKRANGYIPVLTRVGQ